MPSKAKSKQQLSTKNFILAMGVGAFLTAVICGVILNSLVRTIIVNTKVVAGKITASNDLTEKVASAPVLIDNYKQLGDKRQLIEHALPTSEDFPQIVSIVESMSTTAGVKLKTVTPNTGTLAAAVPATGAAAVVATPATDQPTAYQFSMTAQGGYPQLLELLKNIELSARPMKVTAIKFSGDSGSITADMSITTYYQAKADIADKKEKVQ